MKIFNFLFFVLISIFFPLTANQPKQYLPIGRSTFSRIIKDNCTYVDKTELIYSLLKSDTRYFFIARPRQFGRSLLLTTLESFFGGEKDLFKKFSIAKSDYSWQQSPVILLDFFGTATYDRQGFDQWLCRRIQNIAQQYNISTDNEKNFADRFKKLVVELANRYGKNNVALLVDEYDKPLLDRIDNKEQYKEMESVLKTLYDAIGACDHCWRFVFFTGLTKCSKQVVFSGIQTLFDISENEKFANLCGFSQTELLSTLKPQLQTYAQAQRLSLDKTIDLITAWCGGYNFSQQEAPDSLINPHSALYHLQDQKATNYFFDGCTPSFLIHILKQKKYSFDSPHIICIKKNDFETYDQQTILPEVALYAAGYFTLHGFDKTNNEYLLKSPNKETEQAFQILKKCIIGP
ncbi:MAG: AAA family ATPase [bacterium]